MAVAERIITSIRQVPPITELTQTDAVYSPAVQGGDGPATTPEEVAEDLRRIQLAIKNLSNTGVQRPRQPEKYGQSEPDIRLI